LWKDLSWLYILDPFVPPGPELRWHDVDVLTTTVISVDHPAVERAYRFLQGEMDAASPRQQENLTDLIFARKIFLDNSVPGQALFSSGAATPWIRAGMQKPKQNEGY
jgi:hypothetical protein